MSGNLRVLRSFAVAEAEDLLDRDALRLPRVLEQGLGAVGLARLRAAYAHDRAVGRFLAEVVVEAEHAVHVGAREVQLLGEYRYHRPVDVAELRLDVVQDRQQRAPVAAVCGHRRPRRQGEGRGARRWACTYVYNVRSGHRRRSKRC